MKWLLVCLAVSFMVTPAVAGAGNIVLNGSFESGTFVANAPFNYDTLNAGSTDLTDWTVLPNGIAWGVNPTDATPAVGTAYVDLSGAVNPPTIGAIQQTLNTTAGVQYILSFDSFGSVASVTMDGQALSLSPGIPFTVNSTVWTPQFASFTANSAQTIMKFTDVSPSSTTVGVDDVSVLAAVPEPATMLFLGFGLVGLFGLRREFKK